MNVCASSRCHSPIACGGFGYCRELNMPHHRAESTSWVRSARHSDVPALAAEGWKVVADLGLPHSHYAVLMQWMGDGEPSPSPPQSPTAERDAR